MKKIISLCIAIVMCFGLVACGNNGDTNIDETHKHEEPSISAPNDVIAGIKIDLSDSKILVDGEEISTDTNFDVYAAHDIVYYEDGKDFTYGEGLETDAHSKEEADKHVVVHITKPGTYILEGTLSAGQIAIDLGKDAKTDPTAVVNLYLDGVNITNTLAPAIIFYNVYEPFDDATEETATKDVDTSKAGANVYIVDGSVNSITGSHVARIYKPESVVLNEEKTEVIDEKKLHKYDAAFYSKMTMNINGGKLGTGVLDIVADNEGMGSEMHLTINGGDVHIHSVDDGINTNEDFVSVTTINGGRVYIVVSGSNGEGDGIDSNGWIIVNGGYLHTEACGKSPDSGLDSDLGVYINGGTIMSSGRVTDAIAGASQNFAIFNFNAIQKNETYELKDESGNVIVSFTPENTFKFLLISSPELKNGKYTLWSGDVQFEGMPSQGEMGPGMRPGNEGDFGEGPGPGEMPEKPEGTPGHEGERPDHVDIPTPPGQGYPMPTPPSVPTIPCVPPSNPPEEPGNVEPGIPALPEEPSMDGIVGSGITVPGRPGNSSSVDESAESSSLFEIVSGGNYFSYVKPVENKNISLNG